MRVLFLSADEKKMAIKHLLTFSLPKAIPGCVTSMILWLRVLLMVQSVNKLIFEELMWVGRAGNCGGSTPTPSCWQKANQVSALIRVTGDTITLPPWHSSAAL